MIGIKSIDLALPTKQESLVFDRIGILGLESYIDSIVNDEIAANIKWLLNQGFLIELKVDAQSFLEIDDPILLSCLKYVLGSAYIQLALDKSKVDLAKATEGTRLIAEHFGVSHLMDEMHLARTGNMLKSLNRKDLPEASNTIRKIGLGLLVRAMNYYLREYHCLNCVPIVDPTIHTPKWLYDLTDGNVVHIIIHHFPVPAENVPWEAILEFRNDPESQSKFFRIRHWIKKIVKQSEPSQDLSEEIEYLVHDYTEYMRIEKMKFFTTPLQIFFTSLAGFAEDIMKMRLESAVNRIFSVRQRRVKLMEAERLAPGREIAYLVKARETFKDL